MASVTLEMAKMMNQDECRKKRIPASSPIRKLRFAQRAANPAPRRRLCWSRARLLEFFRKLNRARDDFGAYGMFSSISYNF